MRKIFGVLLSVLCICCAAIGLTGCSNNGHVHTYSEKWSQSETEHWHSATCGHNVEKDRAKHTFDENKKCTVCDYITVKPLEVELQSSVFNIDKSSKTGYLKVANAVTDYDFSDKFTVADGARFDVCTDKQCSNKIASKKTDIVVGDNIFYILVTNGNDVASYTVTLRRRPIYTVTFDTNGGSEVEKQQVEEENYATEPATSKRGYDFDEWDYDFSSPILGDTTIGAKWNILTYNITYELNGGKNAENNPTTYTVEDEITLSLPAKTGYIGNWNNGGKIEKGSIGDITFAASYTLDRFNVVVKPSVSDICSFTDKSGVYSYNTPITLKISDIYLGYEFVGWYNGETLLSADNVYTFNVPANDITITAKLSVKEKMKNYVFSSTTDSCKIIKAKDEFIPSAVIPDYVTSIANAAFLDCVNLTSVTIGNGVTSIGYWAFGRCYKLVEVINKSALNIEKGSEYNGGGVGYYALNIKTSGESDIINKDDYLFYTIDNHNYLLGYIGNDKILILPQNFNGQNYEVYTGAFYSRKDIISVTIPESVTAIGDSAFDMCYRLVEVINKSSLTITKRSKDNGYIGYYALNIKTSGESDIINKDDYLFYTVEGTHYLVSYVGNDVILTLPESYNGKSYEINRYAFCYYYNIVSVTIPESVTAIGDSAFEMCYKLVEVINKSALNIEKGSEDNGYVGCYALNIKTSGETDIVNKYDYLFYTADNVNYLVNYTGNETNLTLPRNFNGYKYKIHNFAFCVCIYVESVTIPDSVTSIGEGAFAYCSGLTSITIPDSVTSIGSWAFGCSGLTSVTIPDNVNSIGSGAFCDCRQLKEIVWNAENCTIEDPYEPPYQYSIFGGGTNLINIIIGENVKSIPNCAFRDSGLKNIYYAGPIANWCTISGLGNIMSCSITLYINGKKVNGDLVIPDSVTSIGDYAFSGCSGLTSITIPDSVTSIGNSAFYNCSGLTSITIPDSVTSIGNYAFEYCSSLTSVIIPDSVTSIGDYAFSGCSGLTSITIPDSVTSIGDGAFYACSGLTSITIPDSVTSIGESAFYNCSGLTSITIPDSVTSIGDGAFSGCSGLTSITIPNSVTSIGGFSGCSGLTSITIPDSVTSIGDGAFYNCSGLTSITIPDSVTSIGDGAFYNCSGLTSITIPDSVTSIGWDAFSNCYKLVEVINKSGLNITKDSSDNGYIAYYALNVKKDGTSDIVNKEGYLFYTYDNVNYLLAYVGSDTDLTLPDGYNGQNYELNNYAFYNCSSLTSVTIPDSVTSIGDWAFRSCSGLTSVTIGNSVTSIGNYSFGYCSGLTSVTIGNGVTSIGESAFYGCSGLTSITIPESVASIGHEAFEYCRGLTSITIPESVTSIGWNAFSGCSGIESFVVTTGNKKYHSANNCIIETETKKLIIGCKNSVIPTDGSVTSIGDVAFAYCSGLTSVIIPDSVTSIGYEAFYYCSGLTNITIPESVTSIGSWAFGCSGLTNITIPESVTSIGDEAFYYCSGLTSITIPESVTSIGYEAFRGCSSLTSVTIPDSVNFIGSYAFYYCSKLKNITYTGTIADWKNIAKGIDWNYAVPTDCVIHCTDGDIKISD